MVRRTDVNRRYFLTMGSDLKKNDKPGNMKKRETRTMNSYVTRCET